MPTTCTVTEFQPKRALSNSNPLMDEGQARNPNTTYNGYKWNSGNLLDMEAHMPSTTQNNPKKKNKKKQPRKEEYP